MMLGLRAFGAHSLSISRMWRDLLLVQRLGSVVDFLQRSVWVLFAKNEVSVFFPSSEA